MGSWMPYVPKPYGYNSGGEITQLMLMMGQRAAESRRRRGEIWANAIRNIGQSVGHGIDELLQKRAESKRNEALTKFIDSGAWQESPEAAMTGLVKILGPQGVNVAEGLAGAMRIQRAETRKEAMQALPMVARGLLSAPETARAPLYNQARTLAVNAGLLLPEQLPEKYSAELVPVLSGIAGLDKPSEDSFTLSPGQTRYDKSGKPIATAPDRQKEEVAAKVGTFEDYVTRRFGPSPSAQQIEQARRAWAVSDNTGGGREPKMYEVEVPGPNGTIVKKLVSEGELRGGVTMAPKSTGNKPVTGAERQALAFYNRAKDAVDTISTIESRVSKYGPLDQQRLGYEGPGNNYMKTDEMQAYRQAQRAFTEARLRKESGAAIPESEFANDARTYFAQPGDSPKTIEQKRLSRAKVLNGMGYAAGRAYEEYYGETMPRAGGERNAESTPSKSAAPSKPANATPRVGDIRVIKGQTARWDGHGWLPVK